MIILFFFILCTNLQQTFGLNADFKLLSYNPPTFNLSFDETINFPKFQILLNNKNLSYDLISTQNKSNYFVLEITNSIIQLQSNLQRYALRFNQPLNIGTTSLSLDQYIIRAKLAPVQYRDFKWLAITIVSFCYLFSFFDIIGLWLLDYVQIYILLVSNSFLATDFEKQIAQYFLLQFPTNHGYHFSLDNQKSIIFKMLIPIIVILLSFIIGIVFRLIKWNTEKYTSQLIQKFFKYHFAISMGFLFTVALVVNLIGFSKFFDYFQMQYRIPGSILTYVGSFVLFGFLFIELIVVNPRIKQNKQKFKQYQNSQHYASFSKFYSGLRTQKWISRNFHLFITIKKVVISIVCGYVHDFYYVVLTFQVIHLFYIFTLKPYKYQFYNNFEIVVQSLIVIQYFYIFETDLYFKMSSQIYTHFNIEENNLARTIFFSIIFFILLLGNCYETYERIVGFRAENNVWTQKKQQHLENQKNIRDKKFSTQTQDTGVRIISNSDNLQMPSPLLKNRSLFKNIKIDKKLDKKQEKLNLLQKDQKLVY